jgi:hypothetical protein
MPPVTRIGLLRCSGGRISSGHKNNTCSPTSEKAMILFTSATQNIAAPVSGAWSVRAIVRDMLNAWLSHHQRLADLGIGGDL